MAWPRLVGHPPALGAQIVLCAHQGAHAYGHGKHELRGSTCVTVNGWGGGDDRNQRFMCLGCVLVSLEKDNGLELTLTSTTAMAKCRLSPGLLKFPPGHSLAVALQLPCGLGSQKSFASAARAIPYLAKLLVAVGASVDQLESYVAVDHDKVSRVGGPVVTQQWFGELEATMRAVVPPSPPLLVVTTGSGYEALSFEGTAKGWVLQYVLALPSLKDVTRRHVFDAFAAEKNLTTVEGALRQQLKGLVDEALAKRSARDARASGADGPLPPPQAAQSQPRGPPPIAPRGVAPRGPPPVAQRGPPPVARRGPPPVAPRSPPRAAPTASVVAGQRRVAEPPLASEQQRGILTDEKRARLEGVPVEPATKRARTAAESSAPSPAAPELVPVPPRPSPVVLPPSAPPPLVVVAPPSEVVDLTAESESDDDDGFMRFFTGAGQTRARRSQD